MEYRIVGNSGLKVSQICLGVMNFGDTTDEKAAAAIIDRKGIVRWRNSGELVTESLVERYL